MCAAISRDALPVLRCERRDLQPLSANPHSAFWTEIPPIALRETVGGGLPRQGTDLRVAWSTRELRVLFHCADTHPWATLREHDAPLYEEEVVEVFLDPVGDRESYFEIEVNPLNAVLDVVLRKNRSGYLKDFAWNCDGLATAVGITPAGWSAELSIPFGALVADPPPGSGTEWRANFYRIDRPEGAEWELSAWSPTGRPRFHTPERFGRLYFAG